MSQATMDPTVQLSMQQNFAGASNAMIQLQESAAAGDKLVAELIRNAAEQNADLNSKSASELQTLVTTAAANTLLNGALAAGILGQRSAGGQPQSSADNAGVGGGGPATK